MILLCALPPAWRAACLSHSVPRSTVTVHNLRLHFLPEVGFIVPSLDPIIENVTYSTMLCHSGTYDVIVMRLYA